VHFPFATIVSHRKMTTQFRKRESSRRETAYLFFVLEKITTNRDYVPRFPLDGVKCNVNEYPGRLTGTL